MVGVVYGEGRVKNYPAPMFRGPNEPFLLCFALRHPFPLLSPIPQPAILLSLTYPPFPLSLHLLTPLFLLFPPPLQHPAPSPLGPGRGTQPPPAPSPSFHPPRPLRGSQDAPSTARFDPWAPSADEDGNVAARQLAQAIQDRLDPDPLEDFRALGLDDDDDDFDEDDEGEWF